MTEDERGELLSELARLRDRLEKNEQLFDLTTDAAETEALIYEHKAFTLRYSELFRRARALGKNVKEKESAENGGDNIPCGSGAADE